MQKKLYIDFSWNKFNLLVKQMKYEEKLYTDFYWNKLNWLIRQMELAPKNV